MSWDTCRHCQQPIRRRPGASAWLHIGIYSLSDAGIHMASPEPERPQARLI